MRKGIGAGGETRVIHFEQRRMREGRRIVLKKVRSGRWKARYPSIFFSPVPSFHPAQLFSCLAETWRGKERHEIRWVEKKVEVGVLSEARQDIRECRGNVWGGRCVGGTKYLSLLRHYLVPNV